MSIDYLPIVNLFQSYYDALGPREQFLFYSQVLPRKKTWNKYIKAQKETKYESWMLEVLAHYFQVSQFEVEEYLNICLSTREGKIHIQEILEKFGIEPKKIKKSLEKILKESLP